MNKDTLYNLVNHRAFQIVVGVIIVLLVAILMRTDRPGISVSAEHLPGWHIGPFEITNAYLTSWIVVFVILVVAGIGTSSMKLVPSVLQNVIEFVVEGLYNLTEGVAGPKWAPRFFIIPATIFIYVLVSNWFGLIPFFASGGFGYCYTHEESHAEEGNAEGEHAEEVVQVGNCEPGQEIIPLFRSPSADLNNTLMLALVTQITAQVFGVMALGAGGYFGKFWVIDGLKAAFEPDEDGNQKSRGTMFGQLSLGVIDLFVGLLEGLSEFIKVIAFTFRLFGNIFAGEVMLIVLAFLLPLLLTVPFLGFEIFVGLVQAFIFFILSVAFYTVAVTPHDHEEEH